MIVLRDKNFSGRDLWRKIKDNALAGTFVGGTLTGIGLASARSGREALEILPYALIPTAIGGGIGIAKGIWDYWRDKRSGAYQRISREKEEAKQESFKVTLDEPETTEGLLKKYPKLNDLKDFIVNEDSLEMTEIELDSWGILKDWQSLECDIADEDDPLAATVFLRKKLKSQDWISVLGYGEVGYRISENCFYEIDTYSSQMIKGKIEIKNYKKKLIDIVNRCINDKDWCIYYDDYTDEDRKRMNREILEPLKRMLKI